MNETGQAVLQLNECAVVLESLHGSVQDGSDFQVCDLFFARFALFLFQDFPGGQYQTVVGLIHVDNLNFDVFQKIGLKIFDIGKGKLGRRNKSSQSLYHGDDAAVYNTLYLNRKNCFVFHIFCDSVPGIGVVEVVFVVSHGLNSFCFL